MVPKAMMAGAATLERRLEALELRVHALEAGRRPRDAEDAALRRLLAERTRGLAFRSGELLAHARAEDPILAAALAAATIDTEDQAGAWLRDHVGTRDGITIRRLRRRRGWQVVHVCT